MTKIVRDEFENDPLLSDINRILNMTNKEAADILEKVSNWVAADRKDSKTAFNLAMKTAMKKAVTALRKEVLYVCDRTRCENCSNQDDCFMTSDINHAANFVDAGNGIYIEQTQAIIGADLSELPDYTGTPDNSYVNPELGESEDSE